MWLERGGMPLDNTNSAAIVSAETLFSNTAGVNYPSGTFGTVTGLGIVTGGTISTSMPDNRDYGWVGSVRPGTKK